MRVLMAVCLAAGVSVWQPPAILVSAAISLTDVLEELGRTYTAEGGATIRFNFAGSNVLARQIVNGAPADVFISADEAQMQVAERAGAVIAATRVDLLGNRLAVLTTPALAEKVTDVRALLAPDVRRIAIGDPEAVPAGVYARQYLQVAGVWEGLRGRLVPVGNVRAALAAVDTGSVQAAIVYESDVKIARTAALAFVVAGSEAPRIVYPAAVVSASKNRSEAERWLRFLRGDRASDVFRKYRFVPLAERR
jgi:molybdate transport system substrate-binding protein